MNRITIIISFVTLLFCILIAFDVSPFLRGPAPYPPQWRWAYDFTDTFPKIWLPFLTTSVIGWLFLQIRQDKKIEKREKIVLAQFVFLYFLFQLSVVFFQRAGAGVLLHRIIDPGLNGYFSTGIAIHSVSDFLKNYNQNVLYFYQHAQGHPPFAVLFFYFLKQVFYFIPIQLPFKPGGGVGLIWENLLNSEQLTALFSAIFIPFLSSLTIIPLYKLTKYLYGIRAGYISILLYISVPSVILFTPLNDVFLPIFTVWSLFVLLKGTEHKSNLKLFFSGLILFTGAMFSISLLPLIFVLVVLFFVRKKVKLALGMELSFLFGFLLIPFVIYYFFGLNFAELIKVLKSGLPEGRPYTTWLFYNLYDFFIFCGIPIIILFFVKLKEQVKFVYKKLFSKVDLLIVSFVIMLVTLDLSGTTRGEVSRIWLPFVPLIVIPAANLAVNKKLGDKQILLIFALGIIQLLVMQEFWITLY